MARQIAELTKQIAVMQKQQEYKVALSVFSDGNMQADEDFRPGRDALPAAMSKQLTSVAMVDNTSAKPTLVVLDTGARPILIGRRFAESLNLKKEDTLRTYVKVKTATGGTDSIVGITKKPIQIILNNEHP
eukprot:SM000471S16662  [mRNA]  locus=s471:9938:10418:+ [translate_table: standard]